MFDISDIFGIKKRRIKRSMADKFKRGELYQDSITPPINRDEIYLYKSEFIIPSTLRLVFINDSPRKIPKAKVQMHQLSFSDVHTFHQSNEFESLEFINSLPNGLDIWPLLIMTNSDYIDWFLEVNSDQIDLPSRKDLFHYCICNNGKMFKVIRIFNIISSAKPVWELL